MSIPFRRSLRAVLLAAVCLIGIEADRPNAVAGEWTIPLAQAAPPGKMFIVEGIVVVVLFAGAVFAVCRASGRS